MAHYKISDVAEEVKDRENNPSESKYDRFVGLEHYVSGDVEITHFGSTESRSQSLQIVCPEYVSAVHCHPSSCA